MEISQYHCSLAFIVGIYISAGRIVARLHARKPNEQIKRSLRGNVEGDAEVALANIGLLLRELGWARD